MKVFLKILISIAVFVALYFVAIIPLREGTMSGLVSKFEKTKVNEISVYEQGARGITVTLRGNQGRFKARVPFGMNFFIGIIGLIMISATRKFFFIEVGVQLIFGIIIGASFLWGSAGNVVGLQISDMSSIYFLPLSSLFMVVLAFIEKKSVSVNNEG